MATAGTAYVDIRPNLASMNRELAAQMSGRRMRRFGVLGGAAIGAGLTVAVKRSLDFAIGSAVKFESSFADVRKTVDTNARGFARLERGIRRMAKEIPTSADRLAEMAGVAGQLGIRAPDIIRFTRVVADLGETTNLAGEEAATTLARLANIMGTSSRDYRRLGSTIVELGNNLATTEAEITDMALRLAKAGVQVGLSEAQVLAFAGALSSVGIEAQAGGSAYARAFIRMSQAVDRGGEQLGRFARVAGMARDEFRNLWRRDAALAMVAFTEGLGRMQREGKSVFPVLEQLRLHDIRVRDALLGAAASGDLFRRSLRMGTEEWRRNTALTREANLRYETVAARWATIKNRVRDFGIELGRRVLPKLSELMDILTDDRLSGEEKFQRIADAIGDLISEGVERGARAAVESGPKIVAALANGIAQAWHRANPISKLFTAAALIRMVGGRGALFGAGALIGSNIGAGVAAGMAGAGGLPSMAGGASRGGVAAGTYLAAVSGAMTVQGGMGYTRSALRRLGAPRETKVVVDPAFRGRAATIATPERFAAQYGHLQGARYAMPVSQLGTRRTGLHGLRMSASGMMADLRSAALPIAKRVGLAGVGLALADGVISEFGRRAQMRSGDLIESLRAKAQGSELQKFNILGYLHDAFRPSWMTVGKEVLPEFEELLHTRKVLSQREVEDLAVKRDRLDLTKQEKAEYDRIIKALRIGSRLRLGVSATMDPRALQQVQNNFRALRSGALTNLRDILKVSRRNMNLIAATWGTGTARGREAAAKNMRATAAAIERQMRRSGRVTNEGVQRIVQLLREADLIDPTRRMARAFGREWARGMDSSKEITRRGLRNMIAEARKMPGPMRKVALETWLAQLDAARKNRRITQREFEQLRSRVASEFTGMRTASRRAARVVPANVFSMVDGATDGFSALAHNANRTLVAFGARPLRFDLKRARVQRRQRGGRITPVPGAGSGDRVPALLEPGEVVINREAVRAMGGPHRVNRINHLIPRFQTGGIVGRIRDAMGALPGLDALATILGQKFGLRVTSGLRPGAVTTTGNPSDHGWGGAIDVSNGVTTPEMDAAHAWLSRTMAPAIKQMLYRTWTGGNHFNHIHIALWPQFAQNPSAVLALAGLEDLPRLLLGGADGALKTMGQGALDRVRAAGRAAIRRAFDALSPKVGPGGSDAHPAGAYSKRMLMDLWREAGGDPAVANLAAAVALAESGGNPGATNTNSNGTVDRGLWQINSVHGALSTFDPLANARAAVQISSGGRNWQPWVAYTTGRHRQFLRRGGIVQALRLATGGIVGTRAVLVGGGGRARVRDLSTIGANIREIGRWLRRPLDRRQRARTLRYAVRLVSGIGVPASLQQQLTDLSTSSDTWAEFAQRAGSMSYEMLWAERTPQLGADGRPLLGPDGSPLFHEPGDPILDSDRRPMTHFATVHGLTEAGWTQRRLSALFELRNKLVQAAEIVRGEQTRVARLIADVRRRLRRLQQAIRRAGRERREVERERRRQEQLLARERTRLRQAERELESATGSLQAARLTRPSRNARTQAARQLRVARYGRRVAALTQEIPELRASIARRERQVRQLRGREARIRELQDRRVTVRRGLQRLLGDDRAGLLGRRAAMEDWLPGALGSGGDSFKGLVTVQGLGGPMSVLTSLPPMGVLGGEIFDAQQTLRQLAVQPQPVPLPEPAEADKDDSERLALTRQLLEETQKRLAVSQAQYSVLRDPLPPFGGSFRDGGYVPGPAGAARTIIAHGGERVLSLEEQRDARLAPPVQVRVVVEDGAVDRNRIRVEAERAVGQTLRQVARGARSSGLAVAGR